MEDIGHDHGRVSDHDNDPTTPHKNEDRLSILHYENLSKSINQLSLSSSMITLNLIDCLAGSPSNMSGHSHLLEADNISVTNRDAASSPSKFDSNLQTTPVNEHAPPIGDEHEFKLKSPYGDWCAFE